jgi:hypothetical protein
VAILFFVDVAMAGHFARFLSSSLPRSDLVFEHRVSSLFPELFFSHWTL